MLSLPLICIRCIPVFITKSSSEFMKHNLKHEMEDMLDWEKKLSLIKNAKHFSGGKFNKTVFKVSGGK